MKRKLYVSFAILLVFIGTVAGVETYAALGFDYSFDTNVFSDPLPTYDASDGFEWLSWRRENPFLIRHSFGLNITSDIFFQESSRTGLSLALSLRFPFKATTITPIPEDEATGFAGPWEYRSRESISEQHPALFGAIGPVFRIQFGSVDIGVATRISIGSYDFDVHEIVMGIQASPFINAFISDMVYINLRLEYDAHLMRFIESSTQFFDLNYQMITLAPSLGIGIRFH